MDKKKRKATDQDSGEEPQSEEEKEVEEEEKVKKKKTTRKKATGKKKATPRKKSKKNEEKEAEVEKVEKEEKEEKEKEPETKDNEEKVEEKVEEKGKEKVEDEAVPGTSTVDWPATGMFSYLKDNSWREVLASEVKKSYIKDIIKYVEQERKTATVYPPENEVFTAFNLTPFNDVKVVIIGQDPYIKEGQAHGLSFSVKKGVAVPPSLKNIYIALERTITGFKAPKHGYLEKWAKQGVLMLNATLTVEAEKSNSHQKCGWQTFTDEVIKILNAQKKGIVFMLWGGFAQKRGKVIDRDNHYILEGPHPSPMAGVSFKDCKHFKEANEYLIKNKMEPVDWKLT